MQPLWYEPIYNTTKAALMMFSKTLATEFIKDNIRVNCINPGLIRRRTGSRPRSSSPADKGGDWEAYLQAVADEHAAIKRFGTRRGARRTSSSSSAPPRASYSVGSTYFVDGGMLKTI